MMSYFALIALFFRESPTSARGRNRSLAEWPLSAQPARSPVADAKDKNPPFAAVSLGYLVLDLHH
jgi:hypothetical protein